MQIVPILSNVGSATSNRAYQASYPYPTVWIGISHIERKDEVNYSIKLKLKEKYITGIFFHDSTEDLNNYTSWNTVPETTEVKHLIVTKATHLGSGLFEYSLTEDIVFNRKYQAMLQDEEFHWDRTPDINQEYPAASYDLDVSPCIDTSLSTLTTLGELFGTNIETLYCILWYSPDDKGISKSVFRQRAVNPDGTYLGQSFSYGPDCFGMFCKPVDYEYFTARIGSENILTAVALPIYSTGNLVTYTVDNRIYYVTLGNVLRGELADLERLSVYHPYTKLRFPLMGELIELDLRKYLMSLNKSLKGAISWTVIITYKGFLLYMTVGTAAPYILDRWEIAAQLPIATSATAQFWKQNPTAREQANLQQAGFDVQAKNASRTMISGTVSAGLAAAGGIVGSVISGNPLGAVNGVTAGIDKAQQAATSYMNTMDTVKYNKDKVEQEYSMNLKNLANQNPTLRNMVNLEGNTIYETDQIRIIVQRLPASVEERVRWYYSKFGYYSSGVFQPTYGRLGYFQGRDIAASLTDMRGIYGMQTISLISQLLENGTRFVDNVQMLEVDNET